MNNKIFISPHSFPPGYDRIPDLKTLQKLVIKTEEESQSIRRFAKSNNKSFTTRLICFAIEELEWILKFYTASKSIYLNELSIIRRKFLEIYVDLFWLFSLYKDGKVEIVEDLAKRFYQVGANDFVRLQSPIKNSTDIFFSKSDVNDVQNKSLEKARSTNHIELDPFDGGHDNSKLFKTEWKAHPDLIEIKKLKKTILNTRDRAKYVRKFVSSFTGLKNPPFYQDYDRLNQITHWSVFGLRPMTEEQKKTLQIREINLMLGYLHDSLTLIFDYLGRPVPESVGVIRQEFIYST